MLLCSPVSFPLKPAIALKNLQFSAERGKFSAERWASGPPSADISGEGPLECEAGNGLGRTPRAASEPGSGNQGFASW